MPHVEKVIIARELRGEGTKEDPSRSVLVVYSLDGDFIAAHDPVRDECCGGEGEGEA